MYLVGFDLGSSSIKAAMVDAQGGKVLGVAQYPDHEMAIESPESGWAEQDPEMWWKNVCMVTSRLLQKTKVDPQDIKAVGIAYQMHGLVTIDKEGQVLRPSIIWCDSRAVEVGDRAFNEIGQEACLSCLLNAPGNFTASKLKWVKENEPDIYSRIDKVMLPGDYIAYRMSGHANTTVSGLSEGTFWDFKAESLSGMLMDYYGFDPSLIPDIVPTFGEQSRLSKAAADELGLKEGTLIAYRAGDQPNNALSLNVMRPGEVAATAGTSGVVYGVTDEVKYDPESRVNTFAHVSHGLAGTRLGILLCINGTGILNSWLNKKVGGKGLSYEAMNQEAAKVPVGSENLSILPFGNGAERVLGNQNPGAQISGLDFNRHSQAHLYRAAQEGIAFSFRYGMDIMSGLGLKPSVIRAGKANMFLSPLFRETMATILDTTIELYDTDGAVGAARGAGIGMGLYSLDNAFDGLNCLETIPPNKDLKDKLEAAYGSWKDYLNRII